MEALLFVPEFLAHQRAAGRAKATLRNYEKALVKLEVHLAGQGRAEQQVSASDLVGFVNANLDRYPPDHLNQLVGASRLYFRWLVAEGLRRDKTNPAERLRFVPVPEKPVEALTAPECGRLVRTAKVQASGRFGSFRSAVLALLLLDTGLRLGEALALQAGDLEVGGRTGRKDGERGSLVIRATKTHTVRSVPLSDALAPHLRRYLARRADYLRKRDLPDLGPLFISEQGNRLSVWVLSGLGTSSGRSRPTLAPGEDGRRRV